MQKATPPFRCDQVGSLLRPQALKDAREKHRGGALSREELVAEEDLAIEAAIRKQESIGLRAVTDGEFRRSWWNLDFLAGLEGTEWVKLEQGISFKGITTRAEGVRVSSRLGVGSHPMLGHFEFVKAHSDRMPKMTIPSPSALYTRSGREMVGEDVYPSLDEFYEDLGRVYSEVVKAFYDVGCRYLQLDEVYIALWCDPQHREMLRSRGDDPDKMLASYVSMINAATANRPDDMTITMHLCRGNHRSTFLGEGGYEPVAEVLFDQIDIDGYFMEFDTERAGGFEPLRLAPEDRAVVLGLVTTKSGEIESRDTLKKRIDDASRFVDLGQLCLSPQCGFASTEEGNVLSEDEQWAKLEMIVEIADDVWG